MKQNRIIHLNALRRILFIVCVVFAGTLSLFAQQNVTVTGVVTDDSGETLPGVTILVQGTTRGVTTDLDGSYTISAKPEDVLLISFVGFQNVTVKVGTQRKIDIQLKPVANELDEVTVVAFGKQKKQSVIASITTINPSDLKVPSSNLTTALAGRIAGLISYQRTGEPGADNAEFFVRGVTTFGTGKSNPLILIDGVEMTNDDLARLTVDDIQSFSIMKDANATALYGARGANGVILVTSKEGQEGKLKIQFRMEGSYSAPTQTMDYVDPVTYMQLHNEALTTRGHLLGQMSSPMYSSEKILNTAQGKYPVRYPSVDWQDMLFNDHTFNQRYNMNASGGGKIARYYIALAYNKDNGIIKMDKRNNFNNNISIDKYVLRANVNVNLTKTTEAIVRLHGAFDDYSGPIDDGTSLYNKALNANPVLFQPYYEADYAHRGYKHILFGNYNTGNYLNPYSEMVKGFKTKDRTDMLAQFEVKQDLNFITEGLTARALFNVNRYSLLTLAQAYNPFFYSLMVSDNPADYNLLALNPTSGRETLELVSSAKEQTNTMYFEGTVNYSRQFNEKHDVSGLLVYTLRESLNGSPENLQASLPNRNLGLAGRLTYGYDSRYFLEANFGYNGSERFAKNERFGFFPSIGGGWIVSNESFMQPLSDIVSKLKLKATYGLVGNDAIGDDDDRFYYMGDVNLSNSSKGFQLGYNWDNTGNGISISRYPDPFITWEVSRKSNVGFELNLLNSLEIQLDWFNEKRDKILQNRADIPTAMGLQATPKSNIGKASGGGVDLSVDYSKSFTKNLWTVLRGNFTYASSQYDFFEEVDYSDVPWRFHAGQKISQVWGFVAERLFLDEYEVANSPTQFGVYGAGDIKYKDINGDKVI
ncbi:MAG: TonB-dependent receptor, partial [Bacteroidales bacterium]|nr:TonB-dependent receptor [Bacteroidales bacterium]